MHQQRNARGTVQAQARRLQAGAREIGIERGYPCHLPRARRWARSAFCVAERCRPRGRAAQARSTWGHATRDRDGREWECAESRFVAQGAARIGANRLMTIRTLRYPFRTPSASLSSGSHHHLLSLGPPPNYYTSSPVLISTIPCYRYTVRSTIHTLTRLFASFNISIGLSSSPLRAHLGGRPFPPNLSRLLSVAPFFPPRSSTAAILL